MKCAVLVVAVVSLGACTFERPGDREPGSDPDGPPSVDGQNDGGIDGPIGACKPGFIDLCQLTPRTDALTVNGTMEINSAADPRCVVKTQPGGPDLCVLYFSDVDINNSGVLVIHGPLPVVLASASTITIQGVLDVSSRRSRPDKNGAGSNGTCAFASNPENDTGGGGGGAGGTFGTQGSGGGTGDINDSGNGMADGGLPGAAIALPTVLRGGCPGQKGGDAVESGGLGGPSGGAVFLFARGAITISGRVLASGAGGAGGGNRAGGGGGGAGGLIVIESEAQSAISGLLLASGGGGGEGGTANVTPDEGNPGSDPDSVSAAAGGTGQIDGGNGGSGATYAGGNVVPAGSPQNADGGGGGGGGGNGYILLRGAGRAFTGSAAPAPRMP